MKDWAMVETGMTKHWFADENIRAHLLGNTAIGRAAQPEETAGMVLFLCSDLVDGGYTAR